MTIDLPHIYCLTNKDIELELFLLDGAGSEPGKVLELEAIGRGEDGVGGVGEVEVDGALGLGREGVAVATAPPRSRHLPKVEKKIKNDWRFKYFTVVYYFAEKYIL